MDGRERLRHPRAVAAFRVGLWVVVAVVLLVVAMTSLGLLGVLAVVGGALAAVGQGGAVGIAWVALAGVLVVGATAAGVVVGARRVERRVVAADSRPDPLEAVKERYVRDDIDEFELEARLEDVLGGRSGRHETARRRSRRGRERPRQRRERHRERER